MAKAIRAPHVAKMVGGASMVDLTTPSAKLRRPPLHLPQLLPSCRQIHNF